MEQQITSLDLLIKQIPTQPKKHYSKSDYVLNYWKNRLNKSAAVAKYSRTQL
jgi:hypothetical protein